MFLVGTLRSLRGDGSIDIVDTDKGVINNIPVSYMKKLIDEGEKIYEYDHAKLTLCTEASPLGYIDGFARSCSCGANGFVMHCTGVGRHINVRVYQYNVGLIYKFKVNVDSVLFKKLRRNSKYVSISLNSTLGVINGRFVLNIYESYTDFEDCMVKARGFVEVALSPDCKSHLVLRNEYFLTSDENCIIHRKIN